MNMNYNPRLAYLELCELAELRPLNVSDLAFEQQRAVMHGDALRAEVFALHIKLEKARLIAWNAERDRLLAANKPTQFVVATAEAYGEMVVGRGDTEAAALAAYEKRVNAYNKELCGDDAKPFVIKSKRAFFKQACETDVEEDCILYSNDPATIRAFMKRNKA